MINIAICDDNREENEMINSLVQKNVEELGIQFKISCFNDGEDLVEHINYYKEIYDLIFLDIYMQFSNGIDVARKIRNFDKECKIIFITYSKEYAIDSYDVRAFHYILKPIEEEKLVSTIKLAVDSLDKESKQIIITNKKGSYRIFYKDILYAESKARIVNIHLKLDKVITFYSKLEDFFEKLQDERFFKPHKSFIVNMDYISKIQSNSIFMINDRSIPISDSNLKEIKEVYFGYLLRYS
ncbi:LytR/AlgR family response regulator transcription factor [Clostridium sp. DL1XJH146]